MSEASEVEREIEALAELHHQQWAGWMEYFFNNCKDQHEDGTIEVPAKYAKALQAQIATPYAELTEEDKDKDRAEARKSLGVIARVRTEGE